MNDSSSNPDFIALAQKGVQGLKPYEPGKPVSELERELGISEAVKLASNENPFGPSSKAIQAIQDNLHELSRYPDGNAFELKKALAQFHGVDSDCITIGNGSNDVLELVARVFLGSNTSAAFSQHAFAVYPIVTQAVGATMQIAQARGREDSANPFGHDANAILSVIDETTRVVYIANPNNPTGTWMAKEELKGLLDNIASNVVVVVDEAYFEYVQNPDYPDASQWLGEYPNLVVTRTFSKAYGLAGLRIGYALSSPPIANLLNRVRQPFNANSLAQAAAVAALQDQAHIQDCVKKNNAGLVQVEAGLRFLGLFAIPSVCNFISFECHGDADAVYDALLKQGVIVRPVGNYGLTNFLRISIGSESENQKAIDALSAMGQG
jgi:histidinol-phosphate aminotransferase